MIELEFSIIQIYQGPIQEVFANYSDSILYYPYRNGDSHFFNSCCVHCAIVRYYDLPLDFYLVKKEHYELLFCKSCWENIESEHEKRNIKFDTEYFCYEEIIKDDENPDLKK